MDWSKGFSALYHMTRVDPVTWRDIERIEITGGSIQRESDGMMQSADIDCKDIDSGEQYIRVYLDARQGGDGEHVALFTGLATTPGRDFNGNVSDCTVECYSVLKAADDMLLDRGYYVPAGIGADVIMKKLLSVIPAPVSVADGAPTIGASIVADEDDTYLDMAQKVAEAINWRMRVTGYGEIIIEPYPTEAAATFDPLDNDIIENAITVTYDWYSCPNVFRAIDEDLTAVARDDSEDSALSTINRGREIWMQDTSCNLADNESIGQYAARRLREEQQNALSGSYKRRFQPDLMPGDMVYLKYPKQGLNGLFRITSQSIALGYGATTSEDIVNV